MVSVPPASRRRIRDAIFRYIRSFETLADYARFLALIEDSLSPLPKAESKIAKDLSLLPIDDRKDFARSIHQAVADRLSWPNLREIAPVERKGLELAGYESVRTKEHILSPLLRGDVTNPQPVAKREVGHPHRGMSEVHPNVAEFRSRSRKQQAVLK